MKAFFREQQIYQEKDVCESFELEKDSLAWNCIKKALLKRRVMKEVFPKTDDDNDSVVPEESTFQFCFVGIIEVGGYVAYCYPKFVDQDVYSIGEMKFFINIISHYSENKGNESNYQIHGEASLYNSAMTEMSLLRDYLEDGPYTNQTEIIENDGEGDIDWDSTINDEIPFIQNKNPYYLSLKTRSIIDQEDFFNRLHKCVVTECSKSLEKIGLLDCLGIPVVSDSDEDLDSFGNAEGIIIRLYAELSNQFSTRKIDLLKLMISYFARENSHDSFDSVFLFGIRDFNKIWETACASMINNIRPALEGIKEQYQKIFCSKWYYDNDREPQLSYPIQPDILAEDAGHYYILDAKNYMIAYCDEDERFHKNPGMPDVVKQFVYHKVLTGYIATEKNNHPVINAFLFPKNLNDDNLSEVKADVFGRVEMPTLMEWDDRLFLVPIHLVYLDYRAVFRLYLKGEKDNLLLSRIAQIIDMNKSKN